MILLVPSKSIADETKLDFGLISFILSRFIKTKRVVKLKVEKSKASYSAFYVNKNLIKISLKENSNLRYIICTLLHEIRHYMQVKIFKQKLLFKYKNYIDYYTSPEEKDARSYEKLATEICQIYKCYKKLDDKMQTIKDFEITATEHQYNEEVNTNK